MSTSDDFSFENFQRLEDFPTYKSIIRSFGKPIIPPLITPQKREFFSQLRKFAVLKKKTSNYTKGSKSCEKVEEANNITYMKICYPNVSSKFSNFDNSALSSLNLKKENNYFPTNEMLVSTCKIPCSGVCSTVHNSVIVCPNEIMKDSTETTSTEPENVDSNSETCESYSENDCDCRTCQIHSTEVPYENTHIEQRKDSEDEQKSMPAELDSLPTVIYNRKHPISDTDTESIATYITQSTDLDKYMDFPIEFSSPDDIAVISQTQYSDFRSVSSRSEDASTETIINTENELTPSASTLTGSNEQTDRSNNTTHSPSGRFEISEASVNNRTYSVDSYMLTSKTRDKNLYFRKSESEPLESHTIKNQNSFISPLESNSLKQNFEKKSESMLNFSNTMLDTVEKCSADLLTSTENISDPEFEPNLGTSIRRNSYTLLQPSPALIEAHADCCCQNNSIDASPHSCTSEHQNIPINAAFKKEMVELVLPPMKDRERMFPVLNYEEPSENVSVSKKKLESDAINSEVDSDEEDKSRSISKSLSQSELNSNVSEISEDNFQENTPYLEKDFSLTESSQNVKNCLEKSSEKELQNNCNSEILIMLFKELKDSHQLQANQLMEEQNKQWLRLQKEFKDHERRLFEQLKSTGIISSSANDRIENSTISIVDVNSKAQMSVNNSLINKEGSDSYSSDSSSETLPTVIQNKTDKTLCSSDEPTGISSVVCVLCKKILKNITETDYNLCDTCQEKYELIQSKYDISLQENVEHINTECETYSPDICLKQNVDVKQSKSSLLFIKNDIKSFESFQNPKREGSSPFVSSTNAVLPPKMTSKQINETSAAEDVQLKVFNLNKENNNVCNNSSQPMNQFQMSEVSGNVNQEKIRNSANALETMGDSNTENIKTNVNDNVKSYFPDNINSDLSNMNSNGNEQPNKDLFSALETEDIPQTTFMASDNPVKALKVSSSLTVIKRRISRDVNDPEFLKKLKRVPAMVKGYLTRRLLKTEKIEGMLQTMQESVKLLQNLSEENKKGNPISEQDEELEQKLLNQLITTYEEFYDIFFTISLKERLDLIAQSRKYRLKKVQAAKQKSIISINSNLQNASNSSSKSSLKKSGSNTSIRNSIQLDSASTSSINSTRSSVSKTSSMSDRPASLPVEPGKHSPQHCIRRKKRSITDSRTYTKEDFKECQARVCSNSALKSDNKTPTRVYQSGTNMSRQIKSLVKPVQTKPWK